MGTSQNCLKGLDISRHTDNRLMKTVWGEKRSAKSFRESGDVSECLPRVKLIPRKTAAISGTIQWMLGYLLDLVSKKRQSAASA